MSVICVIGRVNFPIFSWNKIFVHREKGIYTLCIWYDIYYDTISRYENRV